MQVCAMKILIIFFFVTFSTVIHGSDELPDKLRTEFRTLATSKLDYMLNRNPPSDSYLTMLFVVVNCLTEKYSPHIKFIGEEIILEEPICATHEMYDWCHEKSERSVTLMTSSGKSNRTAMAHILCDDEHLARPKQSMETSRDLMNLLVTFMFVLAFAAIFISWRNKLTRPIPIHPSNILNLSNNNESSYPSDSFENITLNSTKSMSKSRIVNSSLSTFNLGPKKFRIIV